MARRGTDAPPAWASAARAAYLAGARLADLQRLHKVSVATLYLWIDRSVAADGRFVEAPVPRRRAQAAVAAMHPLATRAALVRRLWRAADAQMSQLERRMAALDPAAPPGDAEAKALGLIARIVRELVVLDASGASPGKGEENSDERPLDAAGRAREAARIAQLRAAIARRLSGADAGAEAALSGGADAGDDGLSGL